MKWTNSNIRFSELTNGDIAVCKLEYDNWNKIGICLGVYYDGHFYDAQVKEDNTLSHDMWKLAYDDDTSFVSEYCFTGENRKDLKSLVLD